MVVRLAPGRSPALLAALALAAGPGSAGQLPRSENEVTAAHVQDVVRFLEADGKFLNVVWMPAELVGLGGSRARAPGRAPSRAMTSSASSRSSSSPRAPGAPGEDSLP